MLYDSTGQEADSGETTQDERRPMGERSKNNIKLNTRRLTQKDGMNARHHHHRIVKKAE